MAVQAQFGGLAGCLLPYGGGLAEEKLQALLSAAASTKAQQYHSAAGVASATQSELTCNGGGGGLGGVVVASRKRGRDGELEHQYSSAALLPIPGMVVHQKPPAVNAPSGRTTDSAAASTSGRPLSMADALVAAEVDALVRAGCERLRAGLERAQKRQCEALALAAAAGAARVLRDKEAELQTARRRAAELEEGLRQAAAEARAWCGLARSSEAAASGLRATLDALLLRAGAGAGGAAACPAAHGEDEGFGESSGAAGEDQGKLYRRYE